MSMGYDDDDPRGEAVRKRLRSGYYGTRPFTPAEALARSRWAFRLGGLGSGTMGGRDQ